MAGDPFADDVSFGTGYLWRGGEAVAGYGEDFFGRGVWGDTDGVPLPAIHPVDRFSEGVRDEWNGSQGGTTGVSEPGSGIIELFALG